MFLIWIRYKAKSQSTFKIMKNWDFMCLIQIMKIKHTFYFKSNWTEANQNFSNHLIWINLYTWFESVSYGSPLLDFIWIRQFFQYFPIGYVVFDSKKFVHDSNHKVFDWNHTLHKIRINWKMGQKSYFLLFHFTCSFDSNHEMFFIRI